MGLDDGHDQRPGCLGVEHLREALEDPCIHCNMIPLAVRRARLAGSSSNTGVRKRKASASVPLPKQKKGKKELARRVDGLADGKERFRSFYPNCNPSQFLRLWSQAVRRPAFQPSRSLIMHFQTTFIVFSWQPQTRCSRKNNPFQIRNQA